MTGTAQNKTYRGQQNQCGFTLVEIIVGLVTLGLSFVILTIIIFPQAQRSAEPVLQIRAAALGQALLDEIMSKGFDQQFHTHIYQTKEGAIYKFCYEYGVLQLDNDLVLVVKNEEK